MDKIITLDRVLDGLMERYKQRVPVVEKILGSMVREGIVPSRADIENDHIAFRTMGVPQLGIQSLEKIFLYYGYKKRDYYNFPEKKLNAFWYAPPEDRLPRIFISELRVAELSDEAQKIILQYCDQVPRDPVHDLELNNWQAVDTFLHSPLWTTPTWAEYQRLATESEYAAWVIYNRYYLNHFTISVHSLSEEYSSIEKFNMFLNSLGVVLNNSGGTIKTSPDGLLLQSSTVAEMVPAQFRSEGNADIHEIAGSYVEFAERRVLPKYQHVPLESIGRAHRRDGFEAQNADKIFESTFSSQTSRGTQMDA